MLTKEDKAEWNAFCQDLQDLYKLNKKRDVIDIKLALRADRPAQYILELLQNADDAGATEVVYDLSSELIVFRHNAEKTFSLADAMAISRVANSNKTQDDSKKIGQFGIGFKSIFNYANSAEIHSGDYHFCLEDFVNVYNIDDKHNIEDSNYKTVFSIPFVPTIKEKAFLETSEMLERLSENEILFLNNVCSIKVIGLKEEILIAKSMQDKKVLISKKKGNKELSSQWQVFSTPTISNLFDGIGEIRQERQSLVSIAIKLNQGDPKYGVLEPIEGKIFTFFPLTDQVSNLKFHINAPFSINPERSNFRESTVLQKQENKRLLEEISILLGQVAEELISKNSSLEILALMPLAEDRVPEYLKYLDEKVKESLIHRPLIADPKGVTYKAQEVFLDSSRFIERNPSLNLLDFFQIVESFKSTAQNADLEVRKVFIPPFGIPRINTYLATVGVLRINESYFFEGIRKINAFLQVNIGNRHSETSLFLKWLNSLSNSALRSLYILMFDFSEKVSISSLPIFPTYTAHSKVEYNVSTKTLLAGSLSDKSQNVLVHEIFNAYLTQSEDEESSKLRDFFAQIGIREHDTWIDLEKEIKEWRYHQFNIDNELERIRGLLVLFRQDPKRLKSIIGNNMKLMGQTRLVTGKSQTEWVATNNLFVNFEFANRSIVEWLESGEISNVSDWPKFVHECYYKLDGFEEFAKAIGVRSNLGIIGTGLGVTLPALNQILNSRDIEVAQLLWDILVKDTFGSEFFEIRTSIGYQPTQLLTSVTSVPWVPMKNGKFDVITNVSEKEIHPKFIVPRTSNFLVIADFGGEQKRRLLQSEENQALAVKLGFNSFDEVNAAQELLELYSKEEIEALISKGKREVLRDKEPLEDLLNLLDQLESEEASSPELEVAIEEIRARPSYRVKQKERRSYLRDIYGQDGEVLCQLCRRKMPFKYSYEDDDGNRWDYFETVAFFLKVEKESPFNCVALCPICSAKVKNFRSPDFADFRLKTEISRLCALISEDTSRSTKDLYINVELLGDNESIYFNKEHVLALDRVSLKR
jgi:hypothetical protein